MKKTLIALALTTLPVAAMAEVVLYGQAKAGYQAQSIKFSGEKKSATINGVSDFGSRIGFRGNEDLGNGLKAIWQVESAVNLVGGSNTNSTFATRDSFVGLAGDFGQVRLGYLSNYANSDMAIVDQWSYNSADDSNLGLGNFTRFDTRYTGVRYDSPNFGGFGFTLGASPRDNQFNSDSTETENYKAQEGDINYNRTPKGKDKYYAGLGYENAGFFGKYQYLINKNSGEDKEGKIADSKIHRLEVGYNANDVFVALGYQDARNAALYGSFNAVQAVQNANTATESGNTKEAALTVGYHFGNVFPKLSYAHGWDAKIAGEKSKNSKYDQIILGADYSLSKRTTALAQVGWLKQGDGILDNKKQSVKSTGVSVGLKHVF